MPRAHAGTVNVNGFRAALEEGVQGDVRFDAVSRALYATDASVYKIRPLGVVVPRSREDVVRSVQICRQFGCPITLRGGGTSQAGQAIGDGLVVDTSKHLTRILDLDVAGRRVRVEPGIVLDVLNAALAPHRLRFAPDISTASRATIGGMMANNSSGARSVLYGKTIDHVIEQHVVLSDGSVAHFRALAPDQLEAASTGESLEARCYREVRRIADGAADEVARRFPKILRRVGGYNLDAFVDSSGFNLTRLMVGSEGTLGVVLDATLSLVPLPTAKAVMAIQFDDLLSALEAAPAILRHHPSAVEVMDRFILGNTRQNAALHRLRESFVEGDPGALLCVEFYADAAADLPPQLQALEQDLRGLGFGYRYYHALEPAAQARIWSVREAALGLSMATKDDAKALSFVEDTAVAPERLRDYIARFLDIVRRHETTAGVYAHASVGCLHVRPVVNLKTEAGVRTFEAIANEVADLVLEFGGALSGEHGDGLVRSPFMEKMFGPVLYRAFREVKQAFDPDGLFNPGKIVDAPPLTANLRFGAGYVTPQPVTFFDYSAHGGMGGAVEMCSGLGVCRKTLDGTMCPSYMATREEAHSTRGRANVLRLAMAGEIGEAGLGDEDVREVLDLCLECRACKAECPVNVDVARFKSEFLAGYWSRHGTPLRARALGHVHELSRWGSRFAPVSNWMVRSAPARLLNEWLLGLDRRRRPPRWSRRTFARRFDRLTPFRGSTSVRLFNDTFTNFYQPEIGLNATVLLQRSGVGVALAPNQCCGRPLISQGLLSEARAQAAANAELLYPLASRGEPILFLEPSCLSAVREDAPDLLSGEARVKAQAVAQASVLFEDWLERAYAEGKAAVTFGKGPIDTVLLHGHCHQKAMGLVQPAKALLSRAPGVAVVDLDAGCCGMAGSFGYGRDHYEVSRAIGERRLLPAVRGMDSTSVLVASGVSCRHQVEDFTGTRPLHPAEFLCMLPEYQ